MTPKQTERLKKEITKIKRALAADKRRWGGYYDDSQGLRYLPPELYLKLEDYTGALRYFNWFEKNFPDDEAFPVFLFEWTVTLFKTNRLQKAATKAFETYCSNIYLLAYFLQHELPNPDIKYSSNWSSPELTKHLPYKKEQNNLTDFTDWLEEVVASQRFKDFSQQYIDIQIQLKEESPGPKRSALVERQYTLLDDFDQAT